MACSMRFREYESAPKAQTIQVKNDQHRRGYSRYAHCESAVAVVEYEGPEPGGGRSCEAFYREGVEVVCVLVQRPRTLVTPSNCDNSQLIYNNLYSIPGAITQLRADIECAASDMPTGQRSEGFFNGNGGSSPWYTMATPGRMRGPSRSKGSTRIVEDGQPNDSLFRNRDDIPRIRATHRPYHDFRNRGVRGSHSSRKSRQLPDRHAPVYPSGLKDPPTAPRALSSMKNIGGPSAKRPSIPSPDDFPATKKRRRSESPPQITQNMRTCPASSIPTNTRHSPPRVSAPPSRKIVADVAVKCEPSPMQYSVNVKRECSPALVNLFDSPPSPPLFEKLGLPEKTSGSYHVAMVDRCRIGAVSYMEHRQEWKESMINAVRFVRGHGFPPLTIEGCLIR
jgi:hypothetical protein